MSQDERIAVIEAENRQLRQQPVAELAQIWLLLERAQELEARLAKDSHNSNKSPSSERLERKTKSSTSRSRQRSKPLPPASLPTPCT